MDRLADFIAKMEKADLPQVVIDTFSHHYKQVVNGATGLLGDDDITAVDPKEIADTTQLTAYAEAGKKAREKAVMIKLNGGLGTSMGLTKAKSLLEVKNGKTFLEIILKQAERYGVELALMNSFHTQQDTLATLKRINSPKTPLIFLQHRYPKILRKGLAPAVWPQNPEFEWNPPGHGDIYNALITAGTLQQLLNNGILYAFISNSDNLGATMDDLLLGYFAEQKFPFMMEVAERTPTDQKGGHLARFRNGRLVLREIAQCPEDEIDAFIDINRYRFFNTNSIWIHLEFLKDFMDAHKIIALPFILNPKHLDPRDKKSPEVFQIETAMGAAISLFEGAAAVRVPRMRFYPVKKCSDLLAVRSDCFHFSQEGELTLNSNRKLDPIKIHLDPNYYERIDSFDTRFKNMPSLIDCEALTIEGDVLFEPNVIIKGNVFIKNAQSSQAVIREGTTIDHNITL